MFAVVHATSYAGEHCITIRYDETCSSIYYDSRLATSESSKISKHEVLLVRLVAETPPNNQTVRLYQP